MAKLNPITEYKDPWKNLNDPEIRRTLRAFEAEINKFVGPWKYELWLLANGHIVKDSYFEVREVTIPDHICDQFNLPHGTKYRKPEFSSMKNMQDVMPKYLALRKLQSMTQYAKAQEAKEIPLPEPDLSDPEIQNLFQ